MNKFVFAIVFIALGFVLFAISLIIYFYRKKKNINYQINENEKYLRQIYWTFIKKLPLIFFLCGLVCILMTIKIFLSEI
ncbi:LPXTG cell wall anchor domain-containing protein [Mycoplasmopsis cricetuli]|uniref:LPXTG cell wall anchor domain-containing protein n=1 Tax=Mycoplasmopsis cricetuli TaxID=171283 RepID=UPI00046F017C|nr:LPXTG cell wall anchor domain-containing protein [Mycoplasmopsis cricetuli]